MCYSEENEVTDDEAEWDEDISDDELEARWAAGVPVEVAHRLVGSSSLLLETNAAIASVGETRSPQASSIVQPPRISPPKVPA